MGGKLAKGRKKKGGGFLGKVKSLASIGSGPRAKRAQQLFVVQPRRRTRNGR
jgi:hypothetical protein